MSFNQLINYALASMVIAASASACMQEELPGDENGVEQEAVVLSEQPDELASLGLDPEMDLTETEAGDQSLWTLVEDGYANKVEGPVTEAGCVHIQWCNERGPVGTVCIWDACSFDAAYRECVVDANYVCGGITQPAEIR